MKTRPYSFGIDTDAETIFLSFTGSVDADTFDEASDAVANDPRWRNHYDCLCDLRPAKEVIVTVEGMEQLIQRMVERRENLRLQGKIAVLIDRWTLTLLCRLLEFRFKSKQSPFRVFMSDREALDWMGLPESVDIQEKAVSTDG